MTKAHMTGSKMKLYCMEKWPVLFVAHDRWARCCTIAAVCARLVHGTQLGILLCQ